MKGKIVLTVEQAQNHETWLAVRNKGIGGSDAATLLGKNPWKSLYGLWSEKTNQVEIEDISEKEPVYWGNVLEAAVANRFEELTGKKVRRCGTLADEEYPFMLANVDRMVVGENAGLECKTAHGAKADAWKDDEVPDNYYIQCQWYMMITGCDKWYIACLLGGQKYVWKEIPRCEADIEALREAAINFWTKNVEAMVAPAVDGSEDCSNIINNKYPNSVKDSEIPLPSKAAVLIESRDQLKATKELVEAQMEAIDNELKLMMGNNEKGIIQGRTVSWKFQAGSVTVDSKKLKDEMPEIYAKYSKTNKAKRPFSVK